MAHAAGGAALQPVVHQFDYLQPNAAEFEWWESAWNVAWWFVAVGYTLLAVGATLVVGLTTPAQLPIVTIAAALCLQPAANYADGCAKEARKYHDLAEIEHEVAQQLDRLPVGQEDILDARIDRAVPQAVRLVAARYLFWKEESARLTQAARNTLAQLGQRVAAARAEPQVQGARQHLRARIAQEMWARDRLEAFGFDEQALRAKIEAANFHATLCHPERGHNNLRHIVRFESSPQDGSTPRRLAERALAYRYPVADEVVDPYITFLGEQRTYSFDAIERMPENELSALFQQPRVLIVPPEELYARR